MVAVNTLVGTAGATCQGSLAVRTPAVKSEHTAEALGDRPLRARCLRIGCPGPPEVHVIPEVTATNFLQRGDRPVLDGGIVTFEGPRKRRDCRFVGELAKLLDRLQTHINRRIRVVSGGKESDRLGPTPLAPNLAGLGTNSFVWIFEGTLADGDGRRRVEVGCYVENSASNSRIMLIRHECRQALREVLGCLAAFLLGSLGIGAQVCNPLVCRGPVAFPFEGSLFGIETVCPSGAAADQERGRDEDEPRSSRCGGRGHPRRCSRNGGPWHRVAKDASERVMPTRCQCDGCSWLLHDQVRPAFPALSIPLEALQ